MHSTTRASTPLSRGGQQNQNVAAATSSSTPQPNKVTFRIASAPKIKSNNNTLLTTNLSSTFSKTSTVSFSEFDENTTSDTFKKKISSNNTSNSPLLLFSSSSASGKIRGPVIPFGPAGGPSAELARMQRMADLKTAKNTEVFPPIRNPNFELVKTQTATAGSFDQARRCDPPLPWSSFDTPKIRGENDHHHDEMAGAFGGTGTFGRGAAIFGNKSKVDDSVLFFGKKGAMPSLMVVQQNNKNHHHQNNSSSSVRPSSPNRSSSFRVPKMKDVLEQARSSGKELVKKRKAAAKMYQEQRPEVFAHRKKEFDVKEMDFGFDTAQEELERTIAEEIQRARDEVAKEEDAKRAERIRQERGGQQRKAENNTTNHNIISNSSPTNIITPVKELFANAILRAQSNRRNNNNNNNTNNSSNSNFAWTKAHENNTTRELAKMSQAQRQIKLEAEAKKNDSVTKTTSPTRYRMSGASIGKTKRRTFLTDAQIAAVANSAQSEVIASPAKLLFSSERKEGDDNDAADREFDKKRQMGTTQAKMKQERFHPFRERNRKIDGSGGGDESFAFISSSPSQNNNYNSYCSHTYKSSPTPLGAMRKLNHQNNNSSSESPFSIIASPTSHHHHHHFHSPTSTSATNNSNSSYRHPHSQEYNPVMFSSPLRLNTSFTNRQKVVEVTKETSPFARQETRRSETEHAKLERLAAKLLSPEHLMKTIQRCVEDEDKHAWFRDFAADVDADDGGASKLLKQKQRQDQIEEAWKEFNNNNVRQRRRQEQQLGGVMVKNKNISGASSNNGTSTTNDDDDDDETKEDDGDEQQYEQVAVFGVNYLKRRAEKGHKKFVLSSSPTATSADHKNAFTEYFEEMNPEEDPDEDLKKYGSITSPERLERMAARELRKNLDVRKDDVALTRTGYKVVDKNPRGLTALFGGVDRDFGSKKSLIADDPYQWEAKRLSKLYPH